ncbi:hypothetical protein PISMIDRAFT_687756 [Pisolithus microcarpus 441]|uniref:Unplaced genomic scaffold scaffold_242, whole genome shotgun sequence n=1 Tax=Pisolithus microcarpus 441 TaxID=765257 RepID=A0A0C9XEE8_9AGAM|nr:hypothetical protein PISMIDRAFT_690836 [Pisolithus microcarpus 441]KIK14705.1 hypothetical protein PISMIDRAFT_687756 [Pisolithus microcarpus 441]
MYWPIPEKYPAPVPIPSALHSVPPHYTRRYPQTSTSSPNPTTSCDDKTHLTCTPEAHAPRLDGKVGRDTTNGGIVPNQRLIH